MLEESRKSKKKKSKYNENLTREESEKRINILLQITSFIFIMFSMAPIILLITMSSNDILIQDYVSAKLKSKSL